MKSNRSDPSIMPGDPKLSEQVFLKETDLQRCIESLQGIICDLLIENEKLRQHLDAEKFLSFYTGHLREKHASLRKSKD